MNKCFMEYIYDCCIHSDKTSVEHAFYVINPYFKYFESLYNFLQSIFYCFVTQMEFAQILLFFMFNNFVLI